MSEDRATAVRRQPFVAGQRGPLLPLPSWSLASCRLRASCKCRSAVHCLACQPSLSPVVRTNVTRLSSAGARSRCRSIATDHRGTRCERCCWRALRQDAQRAQEFLGRAQRSAPTRAIRIHLNRPISPLSAEPCNRLSRVTRARFDQRSECTTIANKGTRLFGRLLLGVYLPSHRCASWPSSFSCFFFGRALYSPASWREASQLMPQSRR